MHVGAMKDAAPKRPLNPQSNRMERTRLGTHTLSVIPGARSATRDPYDLSTALLCPMGPGSAPLRGLAGMTVLRSCDNPAPQAGWGLQ
jgi:hypothetical protein